MLVGDVKQQRLVLMQQILHLVRRQGMRLRQRGIIREIACQQGVEPIDFSTPPLGVLAQSGLARRIALLPRPAECLFPLVLQRLPAAARILQGAYPRIHCLVPGRCPRCHFGNSLFRRGQAERLRRRQSGIG